MKPKKPSTKSKARRVTLKDVAAAVGVSHVAVSLALRGSAEIPPATRERILSAARTLKYVPDESARRLKGQASGRIAYVASRLAHGFVGQVLVGMEDHAFKSRKYINSIHPYSTWFHSEAREEILRQILYGGLADAVILVSTKPEAPTIAEFNRYGVPLILVEDRAPGCHSVRVDNVAGAELATKHLIQRGCKRLALVAGVVGGDGMDLNPTPIERRAGFAKAMKAAGLKHDPRREADIHYYERQNGREALAQLLKADPKIDGIFCAAGDLVALGIVEEARARGLKVPLDFKLIGYDDIELASLVQPALTTVRQPIRELGAQAFEMAMLALEGTLKKDSELVFKPELILRETA